MSSYLFGVVEIVLLFGVVLGFAFWQLYETRKPSKKDNSTGRDNAADRDDNGPDEDDTP